MSDHETFDDVELVSVDLRRGYFEVILAAPGIELVEVVKDDGVGLEDDRAALAIAIAYDSMAVALDERAEEWAHVVPNPFARATP